MGEHTGEPLEEEDDDDDVDLAWTEDEWTHTMEIPAGHRAWLVRADLPDTSDDDIRAARAAIQRQLDIWVECWPDIAVRPRPSHVPWMAAQVAENLRGVLLALDHFLEDAPQRDTAHLPYERDRMRLQTKILETMAPDTPAAITYRIVLDELHEIYPPHRGFKIKLGTYRGPLCMSGASPSASRRAAVRRWWARATRGRWWSRHPAQTGKR